MPLALASAIVLAGALTAEVGALADHALRDQNGRADSLAAHRGRTVVAMVVTARRLRNLKAWERDLRERFDDLDFVRIADVPADSQATPEQIAEKLTERVPGGVSVWIDMDRRWAETLDLDTSLPNLLVFDPRGTLVARYRGRTSPDLVDEVSRTIESLVERP